MEVHCPGPEVTKLFSCSTQLSMKFQLLIKTKIPANKEVSCFKSLRCCIYHANKCLNANNCWHFNIYEQDKFCAQLSWVWKKFYNLGAWALYKVCLFVWFDSSCPINNLSVKQGRVFLGCTSTKLGYMYLAQGPQRSDASEAQTRGPSVSSPALYHWATALLELNAHYYLKTP